MLSKYVWLISAEKISSVRTCCGHNKRGGLHNKGPHTRGNIKWRSFALRLYASTLNVHDNLCFPLLRAYLLLYVLLYAWVKVMLTFPFFILSFGKLLVFERSWYIYPIRCKLAWIIIVDITLEVKGCGAKTISPYLSLCLIETLNS